MAWTVQPDRDVHIVHGTVPLGLDPSQPADRRVSSKIGIDATRKGDYPARSVPPKEHLDRVRAMWEEYGVKLASG